MSCRQGSNVAAGRCTTRRSNAHRTEERKVLYPWHPWAGCIVHIHAVIEKAAGNVVRCSHDDGASGRLLELPIWMFDRAACAPMRVETFPQADIAALQAFADIARCDGDRRRRGWARIIECSCFGSSMGLSRPESGRGPCNANGSFDTTVEAERSSSICSLRGVAAARHRRRNGGRCQRQRARL